MTNVGEESGGGDAKQESRSLTPVCVRSPQGLPAAAGRPSTNPETRRDRVRDDNEERVRRRGPPRRGRTHKPTLRHGSLRRKTERRGAGPRRQEENLCQPEGWRYRCDAKLAPSGRGRRSRRGRHHRRHDHHHRRGHRRLHVRRPHHRRARRHHDRGRRHRPHHLHGDALR